MPPRRMAFRSERPLLAGVIPLSLLCPHYFELHVDSFASDFVTIQILLYKGGIYRTADTFVRLIDGEDVA